MESETRGWRSDHGLINDEVDSDSPGRSGGRRRSEPNQPRCPTDVLFQATRRSPRLPFLPFKVMGLFRSHGGHCEREVLLSFNVDIMAGYTASIVVCLVDGDGFFRKKSGSLDSFTR